MSQWIVVKNISKENKRYIEIKDTVNNRTYTAYFPDTATNLQIRNRLVTQVKEHRAELAKPSGGIDLSTFESLL